MAIALKNLGFEVMAYKNLDQKYMRIAIDEFGLKLINYDVGLFFYAGHGVQAKSYNYLIPVDAQIWTENDVEYNCVEAGRVLAKMEDAGSKTNIVILDACRDNPYERSWTRSAKGRGLASMNAPFGSIIAYATAPGNTASDGVGENGLYTSALLKYISEPGLRIEDVFKRVRVMVKEQSNEEQIPWESTSLEGDFYFIADASNKDVKETEEPKPKIPNTSMASYTGMSGSFTDFRDGQEYKWVKIGSQIWMAENLSYLPDVSSPSGKSKESPHFYVYGYVGTSLNAAKTSGNYSEYGVLYDWYAAMGRTTGSYYKSSYMKGICPIGWHLPSDAEWKELEINLGMSQRDADNKGTRGTDVGGKLKETQTKHWLNPNTGATNESGFTALPGGSYYGGKHFSNMGIAAFFWSSSQIGINSAWVRYLSCNYSDVRRIQYKKEYGFSVRCLKDE